MERLTLSVAQVCEALGIGRTTVYALISRQALATVKIGRRTLITVDSVKSLLDS